MLLIDLDGTLVDSAPDLAYCIDQTMLQLNIPVRGEQAVRCWVGNGLDRLLKRALVNALDGEPDPGLYQEALPLFNSFYASNVSVRSRLYDGVLPGLDYLQRQGYRLACVTNKAREFTLPLMDDLGIAGYFELIICGDDTAKKKPDPLPLLTAAEKMQVSPRRSLMLGDSVSDVQAARAAGLQIVCLSYGYNHGEDIRSYGPDAVIDSMVQLEALI
ncbi:MAG: phosphoglycolate phosphatase [Gammaproteobacteria bacterium]